MRFNHSYANANLRPSDVIGLPVRHATPILEFYRTAPRNNANLNWGNTFLTPVDYRFNAPPDDQSVPLIVYTPLPQGCYSVTLALALDYPVRTHSSAPQIVYGFQFHMSPSVFRIDPTVNAGLRYLHWNPESRRAHARDVYPYNPDVPATYQNNQSARGPQDWRRRNREDGVRAAPPFAWGYNPFGVINNSGNPSLNNGFDPTENTGVIDLNWRVVRLPRADDSTQNALFYYVKPGIYIIDIAVPVVGLTGLEIRLAGVNLLEDTAQLHQRPQTDNYTRPAGLASTANRVGIFGVVSASTRPI